VKVRGLHAPERAGALHQPLAAPEPIHDLVVRDRSEPRPETVKVRVLLNALEHRLGALLRDILRVRRVETARDRIRNDHRSIERPERFPSVRIAAVLQTHEQG
jgi:hypothetical protein